MAELAKRFPSAVGEARIIAASLLTSNPSFVIDVADQAHLTLQIALTWGAASVLTFRPEGSLNGGASYGRMVSLAPTAGAIAVSEGLWSLAVAASVEICLDFPAGRYDKFRMTFGHTGATTDVINAWIVGSK